MWSDLLTIASVRVSIKHNSPYRYTHFKKTIHFNRLQTRHCPKKKRGYRDRKKTEPLWFAEYAYSAIEHVDLRFVIPERCWRESRAIAHMRSTTNSYGATQNEQTDFPIQALGYDERWAN